MADKHGTLIKEVTRDSFGLRYSDSFLDLFVPVGFAGGLTDPDTGLTRFGYRDYDPTVGRFTAPDPAKDRRGDGDLYDYCVDDPVSRVDPTGLWSKLNFDETRVRRDEGGRFSGGGAGASGGDLHAANESRTATDAGGRPVQNTAASPSTPSGISRVNNSQLHERIRQSFGDEVLKTYTELESLEQRLSNVATNQEKTAIESKIDMLTRKLDFMLRYENVFSQGFRDEQQRLAEGWKAKLTAPDKAGEYLGMMDEIEKAPLEQRAKLIEAFYAKLAKDAGMPQLQIRVVDFSAPGEPGNIAGGCSNGQVVKMNLNMYTNKEIFWETEIRNFFHEQGHEWMRKLIAGNGPSEYRQKYAGDVEKLRQALLHYMDIGTSTRFYRYDYTELHAQGFEAAGLRAFKNWQTHGKGGKK